MRVIMPKAKVLDGQPLYSIANSLNILDGSQKVLDENNIYYEIADQSAVEILLNQENIVNIVNNGGEVEGYLMWAMMPYAIGQTSIYEVEVPEGLRNRTMWVTDGAQSFQIVKKLAQWCDSVAQQTFSADYRHIFMLTNPQGYVLKASEIKVFIDELGAEVFTREEYGETDTRSS